MMDIKTTDKTEAKEVLTKTKPWFNGPHTFPSVKVETPKDPPGYNRNPETGELQPASLGVSITDSSKTADKIG